MIQSNLAIIPFDQVPDWDRFVEAHPQEMRRHALFAEIRPVFSSTSEHDLLRSEGYEWQGYFIYELDLHATEVGSPLLRETIESPPNVRMLKY